MLSFKQYDIADLNAKSQTRFKILFAILLILYFAQNQACLHRILILVYSPVDIILSLLLKGYFSNQFVAPSSMNSLKHSPKTVI